MLHFSGLYLGAPVPRLYLGVVSLSPFARSATGSPRVAGARGELQFVSPRTPEVPGAHYPVQLGGAFECALV